MYKSLRIKKKTKIKKKKKNRQWAFSKRKKTSIKKINLDVCGGGYVNVSIEFIKWKLKEKKKKPRNKCPWRDITIGYTHTQLQLLLPLPPVLDSISYCKQLSQPSLCIYFFQSLHLRMTSWFSWIVKNSIEACSILVHSILQY